MVFLETWMDNREKKRDEVTTKTVGHSMNNSQTVILT